MDSDMLGEHRDNLIMKARSKLGMNKGRTSSQSRREINTADRPTMSAHPLNRRPPSGAPLRPKGIANSDLLDDL